MQIYLLERPKLDFELGGAANLLELPGLNGMLKDAIHDQIAQKMLLPNRIAIGKNILVETIYFTLVFTPKHLDLK